MPGYLVKHQQVAIAGVADLTTRSLIDHQQCADPLGYAAALGISSAAWPLFGLLWPCGLHLAAAMAARPVANGERILDVGCGLAPASLVSHRRGAQVTASDCHPMVQPFLLQNVLLNALPLLPYRHGNWLRPWPAKGGASDAADVQSQFELIMGSDVLCERDEAGLLPQFIGRHATSAGAVMIVDPNRGNRSQFNRSMAALGDQLQQTLIRDPLGPGGPYSGRMPHFRRNNDQASTDKGAMHGSYSARG